MSYFEFRRKYPRKSISPYELPFFTDSNSDYMVFSPKSGNLYSVFSGNELVAKVGQSQIVFFGEGIGFKVISKDHGNTYSIFKGGQLELKIDNDLELEKYGNAVPSIFKKGRVISKDPEKILSTDMSGNFFINGKKVANYESGDGLFQWLIDVLSNGKLRSWDPYNRITFNENEISPLLAICILICMINID